jgi:hypothetical protein
MNAFRPELIFRIFFHYIHWARVILKNHLEIRTEDDAGGG